MTPAFPLPTYFGRRRHWRLSDLLKYERELAGLPPQELSEAEERFLPASQVRERYGVSDMWLHRRIAERTSEKEAA